jgi:hypothetical protein
MTTQPQTVPESPPVLDIYQRPSAIKDWLAPQQKPEPPRAHTSGYLAVVKAGAGR